MGGGGEAHWTSHLLLDWYGKLDKKRLCLGTDPDFLTSLANAATTNICCRIVPKHQLVSLWFYGFLLTMTNNKDYPFTQ